MYAGRPSRAGGSWSTGSWRGRCRVLGLAPCRDGSGRERGWQRGHEFLQEQSRVHCTGGRRLPPHPSWSIIVCREAVGAFAEYSCGKKGGAVVNTKNPMSGSNMARTQHLQPPTAFAEESSTRHRGGHKRASIDWGVSASPTIVCRPSRAGQPRRESGRSRDEKNLTGICYGACSSMLPPQSDNGSTESGTRGSRFGDHRHRPA